MALFEYHSAHITWSRKSCRHHNTLAQDFFSDLALPFLPDPRLKALLPHEPAVDDMPFSLRMNKLYVETANRSSHHLECLHEPKMLPNAHSAPSAEGEITAVHIGQARGEALVTLAIGLEPAFRGKIVDIFAPTLVLRLMM